MSDNSLQIWKYGLFLAEPVIVNVYRIGAYTLTSNS